MYQQGLSAHNCHKRRNCTTFINNMYIHMIQRIQECHLQGTWVLGQQRHQQLQQQLTSLYTPQPSAQHGNVIHAIHTRSSIIHLTMAEGRAHSSNNFSRITPLRTYQAWHRCRPVSTILCSTSSTWMASCDTPYDKQPRPAQCSLLKHAWSKHKMRKQKLCNQLMLSKHCWPLPYCNNCKRLGATYDCDDVPPTHRQILPWQGCGLHKGCKMFCTHGCSRQQGCHGRSMCQTGIAYIQAGVGEVNVNNSNNMRMNVNRCFGNGRRPAAKSFGWPTKNAMHMHLSQHFCVTVLHHSSALISDINMRIKLWVTHICRYCMTYSSAPALRQQVGNV